jgi:DNA-directed RNA polymerase specialized sigma24 family protein
MTITERNTRLLSLLEHVTPLLLSYVEPGTLEFEDLYQDAAITIMHVLAKHPYQDGDADAERAYVYVSVRNGILGKIRAARRRHTLSLDAPRGDGTSNITLADFLPSPYYTDPIKVLLVKERLQEIEARYYDQQMNHQRRHKLYDLHETAYAEVTCA